MGKGGVGATDTPMRFNATVLPGASDHVATAKQKLEAQAKPSPIDVELQLRKRMEMDKVISGNNISHEICSYDCSLEEEFCNVIAKNNQHPQV